MDDVMETMLGLMGFGIGSFVSFRCDDHPRGIRAGWTGRIVGTSIDGRIRVETVGSNNAPGPYGLCTVDVKEGDIAPHGTTGYANSCPPSGWHKYFGDHPPGRHPNITHLGVFRG